MAVPNVSEGRDLHTLVPFGVPGNKGGVKELKGIERPRFDVGVDDREQVDIALAGLERTRCERAEQIQTPQTRPEPLDKKRRDDR